MVSDGQEEVTSMNGMNELGFYTLAGAPRSPRDLIAEVQDAEALDSEN